MTADIWRLSADDSLIKWHRPTVLRSSADWRPMIGRPLADIMMKISSKRRPTVGRSSGDHRPSLHRMTKPRKIGGSVNETFNLGCFDKKVVGRPKNQQKSVPTSAEHRPMSPDFPNFCSPTVRPTVGLSNVTVVLGCNCLTLKWIMG